MKPITNYLPTTTSEKALTLEDVLAVLRNPQFVEDLFDTLRVSKLLRGFVRPYVKKVIDIVINYFDPNTPTP